MNTYRTGILILRIGVAFALSYPAINAIFEPSAWLGYFPPFIRGVVPDMVLLHSFGLFEVLIALWILSGKRIFYPSLIAAAVLLAIVVFDFKNFEVVFRDLSIATAAIALALFSKSLQVSQKDEVQTS